MPDNKLTPAAVLLEAARRMYPHMVFAIVAADNESIDVTSNALNPDQVVELLTEAAQSIKDHGAQKLPSPHNLN
jgi:hypothetical protein